MTFCIDCSAHNLIINIEWHFNIDFVTILLTLKYKYVLQRPKREKEQHLNWCPCTMQSTLYTAVQISNTMLLSRRARNVENDGFTVLAIKFIASTGHLINAINNCWHPQMYSTCNIAEWTFSCTRGASIRLIIIFYHLYLIVLNHRLCSNEHFSLLNSY